MTPRVSQKRRLTRRRGAARLCFHSSLIPDAWPSLQRPAESGGPGPEQAGSLVPERVPCPRAGPSSPSGGRAACGTLGTLGQSTAFRGPAAAPPWAGTRVSGRLARPGWGTMGPPRCSRGGGRALTEFADPHAVVEQGGCAVPQGEAEDRVALCVQPAAGRAAPSQDVVATLAVIGSLAAIVILAEAAGGARGPLSRERRAQGPRDPCALAATLLARDRRPDPPTRSVRRVQGSGPRNVPDAGRAP